MHRDNVWQGRFAPSGSRPNAGSFLTWSWFYQNSSRRKMFREIILVVTFLMMVMSACSNQESTLPNEQIATPFTHALTSTLVLTQTAEIIPSPHPTFTRV